MKDASKIWETIFENIQEIVELHIRECDDPDECEDDILSKITEIKERTKKYIYVAMQH